MKQKKDHSSNLKLIWYYCKTYSALMTGFIIALTLSSLSVLALGKALTYLVDHGFEQSRSLSSSLMILFAITSVLAIATSLRYHFITMLSERVILKIRRDVFNKLIYQSRYFFEQNKIGNLLSSVTNDLALIQSFIATNLSILLRNSVILVGAIIILLSTNLHLFLYIIILIPLVVIPLLAIAKKLKKQSKEAQNVIADMTSHMHEHLSAIKTIQAFSSEEYSQKIFDSQQDKVLLYSKKRITTRSILTLVIIFVVFSTIILLIQKAGTLLLSGKITAGELSAFVFFSVLIAGAFGAITEVIGNLFKSLGAFERINEILSAQNYTKEEILTKELPSDIFPLTLNNVSFTYPSKPDVVTLKNINLNIPKNKITAIVGPSGAGKSTIFNLLLKFYDIDSGSIMLNKRNYTEYNTRTIRSLFSLVPQDPFIFSGSIAENIALSENFDNTKVINALKTAQAYEFVSKLSNGVLTDLGENGAKISAGQRQRIAIARAIYHNSSILLLDEATSNIDNQNEQFFVDYLNDLKQNYTIIVIAHRRKTIQNSDIIYVLDNGEIVEEGTDKELFDKKGLYKKLIGMQSGDG